jgi:outer membrane protein assembly factor BamB
MKHFSFFVLIISTVAARAEDWPQLLGPRRDGTSSEKGLLDSFPQGGPKVIWQRDVGEGFSGPVIAGDRLILFHRIGDNEVVEFLDVGAGKPMWKFSYPTDFADGQTGVHGPRSTPVIAGSKVVTLGAEGMLNCLTLEKGEKIWSRSLPKDYQASLGYFGFGTSPIVEQNLVLVNVGGKSAAIAAFNLNDGKEVWKVTSKQIWNTTKDEDSPSYSSPVVCTVDGTRLAVFFTRTGAVILDAKTGELKYHQRWRSRNDASVNAAMPLVFGDQAYFSSSYSTGSLLLKLRKNGADTAWEDDKIMSNHFNTCVYHDGHLYGFDGRVDSRTAPTFRCVELKSRSVKWEKDDYGNGSLIIADGRLILLTEKGDLCLVQATPAAYKEPARFRLFDNGPCRAHIALANGRLYARDQKKLVCVNLQK